MTDQKRDVDPQSHVVGSTYNLQYGRIDFSARRDSDGKWIGSADISNYLTGEKDVKEISAPAEVKFWQLLGDPSPYFVS